jgi:ribose transport system permease protein
MTQIVPPTSRITATLSRDRRRNLLLTLADQLGLLAVLTLLILGFSLSTRHFLRIDTFITIANQIPSRVLVAVGMTYVLVIGGIDLSVGSVLGLGGAVIGVLMTGAHPLPLPIAILAALGVGLLAGLVNGIVSVTWSVPSFIVTLGMLEIARGLAHLISGSRTAYIGSAAGTLADINFFRLTLPFWIAIAIVAIGQFVLSRTVFGRYMIAVGTNEEAVRLSGISTKPVKVAVFVIAGALAAAGAVIDVSRSQSADPNSGTGLELDVIAAVVIGGTSLMGGRGSVVNSLLGVAIIAILGSGLGAHGASDSTKRMITGCVIVLAGIMDYYRRRLSRRAT